MNIKEENTMDFMEKIAELRAEKAGLLSKAEELVNAGKIIRPAYKYVGTHKEYLPMEDR